LTTGELFLESLSTGAITQAELDWLLSQHDRLTRAEQAARQWLDRPPISAASRTARLCGDPPGLTLAPTSSFVHL
jgi:hypothetical protein